MWPCRHRPEADFAAEIDAHIALEVDRLIAEGVPPDEARRQASRQFGNATTARERYYEARPLRWLDDLRRDIGHAVRSLRRSPGFTAVALLTLAVGIGANTAIFSVVNAVLLRPLPYTDPESLVLVEHPPLGNSPEWAVAAWRERARTLDDFAGFRRPQLGRLVVAGQPEPVDWAAITWNLPSMLGAQPAVGRGFTASDALPEAPAVVMLSHQFWITRFGGDPSVVGRRLTLNGTPMTVVGVLERTFRFPARPSLLGAALLVDTQPDILHVPNVDGWFSIVGRIAQDATPASATTELLAIFEQAMVGHLNRSILDRMAFAVAPLRERLVGSVRERLLLVMGAVAFVHLLVCANVANLLLARASTRRPEFALRRALGAPRSRLVRLVFAEGLMLALGGSIGGLLLAWGAGGLARTLLADRVPYVDAITLDVWVFGFAAATAIATGLICGLAALPRLSRLLRTNINDGSRTTGHRTGIRRALLGIEVAVTFVLIAGAALLVQTFLNLGRPARAFDADEILVLRVSPGIDLRSDSSQARIAAYFEDLRQRIRAIPGVASAAAISHVPLMAGGVGMGGVSVQGIPPPSVDDSVSIVPTTPDYFRTMGIRLASGRDFNTGDRASSEPVAIVNEAFMRHFAPGRAMAGARIEFDGWTPSIVGVVRDVPQSLREPATPVVFVPLAQTPGRPFTFPTLTVVARTDGVNHGAVAGLVEQAAWASGPDVVVDQVGTMGDRVGDAVRAERDLALLFGFFAGVAVLVAAGGVYSVAAYATALRTREIGVRMALGAARGDVARLILTETLRPAVLGVAAGAVGGFLTTRAVASMLFGVAPLDSATFVGTAVALVAVVLLATYLPARRAMRIEPTTALRCE